MDNITLYNKLSALPDNLESEVSDFIDFLTMKSKKKTKNLVVPDFDEPLNDFKEYMWWRETYLTHML